MKNMEFIKRVILNKMKSKYNIDVTHELYGENKDNISVACILDEFSYECFKYEGNFYQLRPDNWKYTIDKILPKFLFVEAAWEGVDKEWEFKIANYSSQKNNTLGKIVRYCESKGIPTVFWAKEDPYDFDVFINAAKLFDFVFTTDGDSIIRYKNTLNHNNIYLLPFAAQPKIHNPINKDKEILGQFIFPGGWYYKFPERCKQIEELLDVAINYDLKIYDRFYNSVDKKNKFPDKYRPYIKEGLDYLSLVKEIKKYKILLNANSVDDSPTNFSRRVFESLGCGIPVVSNYSLGIENYFKDIVTLVKGKEEAKYQLDNLLSNSNTIDTLSLLGLREVLNNHTYTHRMNTILDKINMENNQIQEQGVSVITVTNRSFSIDNILHNYLTQKYANKELIIIINKNSINLEEWKELVSFRDDISVFKLDEIKSLGECLNFAIGTSKYPFISKFDDDDYYGSNYLVDSLNAFKYTDASIVGKYSVYAYMEDSNELLLRYPGFENRYMDYVAGSTITFKKSICEKIKFKHINKSEDTLFFSECINMGYKIYSSDRFNHIISRRKNLDTHTWKISEIEFKKKCELVKKTLNPKDIVFI